jgi:hypothetical protein
MGEQWSGAANDGRDWDDRMQELHAFLVDGSLPEGVEMSGWVPLDRDQAESVIWFLQEITGVLPDNFEMCNECGNVMDTHAEGLYVEDVGHFCEDCQHLAPKVE